MFDKFIRENIKHGSFKLVYPNGDEQVFGDGPASVVWRINDTRVLSKIARNPLLNLGETYIEQGWDVEDGKLAQLLTILRTNFEDELVRRGSMAAYAAILQTWNNLHASMRNVSHHYDLDESLFRAAEPCRLVGDASKARKVLGWEPQNSFRELIVEMAQAAMRHQATRSK